MNRIAGYYNIAPADLLKMLYENNLRYDYRELYDNYYRFEYYSKFRKESENES